MNGIELKSGINDCHWNTDGKCQCYNVTKHVNGYGYSRDWYSKQNCTYTQIGTSLCSEYKKHTGF